MNTVSNTNDKQQLVTYNVMIAVVEAYTDKTIKCVNAFYTVISYQSDANREDNSNEHVRSFRFIQTQRLIIAKPVSVHHSGHALCLQAGRVI